MGLGVSAAIFVVDILGWKGERKGEKELKLGRVEWRVLLSVGWW